MSRFGWIIIAIIAAIIFDVVLLWAWNRKKRRGVTEPEELDVETVQSARVKISFDLKENEALQLTVEALSSESTEEEVSGSRYQITFDPSKKPQPTSIILEPERARPIPITRSLKQAITHPLSFARRVTEGIKRIWDHASNSRFAIKTQSLISRLGLYAQPLDITLFALALTIYVVTHTIGLEDFPIYFFTDEAVQTVLAADLVRDGFHDYSGILLPTYFENNSLFNLSISVYAQVLPYLLFGKSIFVTRFTSVLITLTGAFAIGLILKEIFRVRFWWVGTLLLSITPAWFLHSRTAFETVIYVSLYSWTILFYMLYRNRSPRFFYPTLLFAGLTFYSYSGGQLVIAGTGLLLFLSDLRFHWKNRRTILKGIPLIILLAVPYIRFQLQYTGETYFHLRMLDSYWLHDISIGEKLLTFLRNYGRGISPAYWYFPNDHDLPRHLMKGYGHILLGTLPFFIVGIIIAFRSLRSSEHRNLVILCLASPLGGSIVGIGITRVLSFVIPAAILTGLGVAAVGRWIAQRLPYKIIASVIFLILAWVNLTMLRDSLVNGPTWYQDYGLGGMQFGGKQVFTTALNHLQENPEDRVFVSPSWANGTHILLRFFIPDGVQVHMGNADKFLFEMLDLDDRTLFVLTQEEYDEVRTSDKITGLRIEQTLANPDGSIGFYFVRMRYAPGAEAIFAAEHEARLLPITEEVVIDGQTVQVEHPLFDMGEIEYLFDDDDFTLARTYEANPTLLTLTFDQPRPINGIQLTTGSMDMTLTVRLFADEDADPIEYVQSYNDLPNDPTVVLSFDDGPITTLKMEIEILGFYLGEPKIHLRDLTLY